MNRRSWIRSLTMFLCSLPLARHVFGQSGTVASLHDTLKFALRCRRQLEFDFVALVVQKVAQGELKREMVLSMLEYARKKNLDRPYPYFEAGLKKRAAAIGVNL